MNESERGKCCENDGDNERSDGDNDDDGNITKVKDENDEYE